MQTVIIRQHQFFKASIIRANNTGNTLPRLYFKSEFYNGFVNLKPEIRWIVTVFTTAKI